MRLSLRLAAALGVLLAIYALQLGSKNGLNDYVQRIVLCFGINIILAVGLNLINGTTGQFSIDIAVNSPGRVPYHQPAGRQIARPLQDARPGDLLKNAVIFNAALLVGAMFAGISGLIVGMPSLRLPEFWRWSRWASGEIIVW